MSAEMLAIEKAMKEATKQNFKFQLIVTDSQSSCESFLSDGAIQQNHLVQNIFNVAKNNPNTELTLQWMAGHISGWK